MITSIHSDRVKFVVRLQQKARFRFQEGLFVCEGKRLVREVPFGLLRQVYVESGLPETDPDVMRWIGRVEAAGIRMDEVTREVMAKMAGVVHSQGILAVVEMPSFSRTDLLGGVPAASMGIAGGAGPVREDSIAGDAEPVREDSTAGDAGSVREDSTAGNAGSVREDSTAGNAGSAEGHIIAGNASREVAKATDRQPLIMVLDGLQDPGNLGTILRTAEAAGVTGVMSSRDTVDFYSPKVVRSTMGGIFRVPHLAVEDLGEAILQMKSKGVRFYASVLAEESIPYVEIDFTGATAIVVGNEGAGIRSRIVGLCDRAVRIPMVGEVESLNAGVAAGILLFEAARQRMEKGL